MSNHVFWDVLSEVFCEPWKIRVALCTLNMTVNVSVSVSICHCFYSPSLIMGHMTLDQWNRAIGMIQAGRVQQDVAQVFSIHQSTISSMIRKFCVTKCQRFTEARSTKAREPRKTDARTNRWIVTKTLRNRKISVQQIKCKLRWRNIRVSSCLARNQLKNSRPEKLQIFQRHCVDPCTQAKLSEMGIYAMKWDKA